MCVRMCICMCVQEPEEMRGGCQMSPSITFHLVLLSQVLSLNMELISSARLAGHTSSGICLSMSAIASC